MYPAFAALAYIHQILIFTLEILFVYSVFSHISVVFISLALFL